jgi:hypothetical protein
MVRRARARSEAQRDEEGKGWSEGKGRADKWRGQGAGGGDGTSGWRDRNRGGRRSAGAYGLLSARPSTQSTRDMRGMRGVPGPRGRSGARVRTARHLVVRDSAEPPLPRWRWTSLHSVQPVLRRPNRQVLGSDGEDLLHTSADETGQARRQAELLGGWRRCPKVSVEHLSQPRLPLPSSSLPLPELPPFLSQNPPVPFPVPRAPSESWDCS